MPIPCDCCPTGAPRCALVAVQFTGVAETVAQAGWAGNLPPTIDGITATGALSGYTSPAGIAPTPTPQVTYTHTTPQNRVRGLRLWNQGGSDLGDFDGLGPFTADFYAGATLLATLNTSGANGGAAQTLLLPGVTELSGVDRVVLRDLGKLTGGTVAPLWRELQLVEIRTVFPCRRRPSGVLEWYDENGNLVPASDIVTCPAIVPRNVIDLHMAGAAFNDAANEFMCNIAPAPTAMSGWAVTGPCLDPTAGNPSLDWALSIPSVEMEYGSAAGASGGVIVAFSAPALGTITWPTNLAMMAVGEQRVSNAYGGGGHAVLTYVSGPAAAAPSGTVRMEGGANIGLHRTGTNIAAPIRFRLDFYAP